MNKHPEMTNLNAEIVFDNASLRMQPIFSGYRPSFDSFNSEYKISGMIFFDKIDKINRGEKIIVEIRLPTKFINIPEIKPGMEFNFYEANYIIGHGVILD